MRGELPYWERRETEPVGCGLKGGLKGRDGDLVRSLQTDDTDSGTLRLYSQL